LPVVRPASGPDASSSRGGGSGLIAGWWRAGSVPHGHCALKSWRPIHAGRGPALPGAHPGGVHRAAGWRSDVVARIVRQARPVSQLARRGTHDGGVFRLVRGTGYLKQGDRTAGLRCRRGLEREWRARSGLHADVLQPGEWCWQRSQVRRRIGQRQHVMPTACGLLVSFATIPDLEVNQRIPPVGRARSRRSCGGLVGAGKNSP
jgi:hypothetical protein